MTGKQMGFIAAIVYAVLLVSMLSLLANIAYALLVGVAWIMGVVWGVFSMHQDPPQRRMAPARHLPDGGGPHPSSAPADVADHGQLVRARARPIGRRIGWFNGRPIWEAVEVHFDGRSYRLPYLNVVSGFRPGSQKRELGVEGHSLRWLRTSAGVVYGLKIDPRQSRRPLLRRDP